MRHEGGSEEAAGFGRESSGLEIPTARNIFPITRTKVPIFRLSLIQPLKPTLFLMDDSKPRTAP